MKCDCCGKVVETKADARGTVRIPKGWKRHQERLHCQQCWGERYVLRAIIFPVAGPADRDWATLRARLQRCWQQSTMLANFCVTELAKADVVRTPALEKLPPAPKVYLYPILRSLCPEMDAQSVVALSHAVQGKYNKSRLDVVWRGAATLPRYRYPVPYPVPAAGWRAHWLSEEERVPLVSMRLGGERVTLRLRGGFNFRRQLDGFGAIVSGDALAGGLEIYRQGAHASDHRPGAEKSGAHIMVKLVAWLPRQERRAKEKERTMLLRTDKESFLVGEIDGRAEPWVLNADQVRRWIAAHRVRLDRLGADTKFEKRWPAESRRGIAEVREAMAVKQRHRLHSWCHMAAAMAVGFARRQGVTRISFDDGEKGFATSFPWHELKKLVEEKCQKEGLEFASATVVSEESSGARDGESA